MLVCIGTSGKRVALLLLFCRFGTYIYRCLTLLTVHAPFTLGMRNAFLERNTMVWGWYADPEHILSQVVEWGVEDTSLDYL